MSALGSKKVFAPLLVVLALLVSFLAARTPRSVAASSTSILTVHNGSLTSYQGAATGVQDISPLVVQRGVGIDGAARAGSTHPMHLAGNPFGSAWSANQTLNGIRTMTGSFSPTDIDISLPADGPAWRIGRSYNSRQEESSSHHDSDGYQGKNWFQTSQPEITIYWDTAEGTEDTDDVLYLVYGADRFIEFNREGTSDEFYAVNGAAGVVEFEEDGSGPDTYTYYDQWGYQFVFFGFDEDADPAKGQLWKVTDPGALSAYVGHSSNKDIAIQGQVSPNIDQGYDTGGRILKAYDSEERRFSYTYTTLDSAERLTEVKAETKDSGTWGQSPSGVTEVAKVEYEYYTTESEGDPGDLKLVEITTPLSDSAVNSTRKKYFRYYEGTYHSTTNPGYPHQLKLMVDFDGTRRQDWATDNNFDEDFKTESTTNLKSYASVYIEYDSSYRANEVFFNGACGCGGGSTDGVHLIEYEDNTSGYTDGTGYDTAWMSRVVVTKPEGSFLTQYFDEAGQSLHQVITDDDPDNGTPPDRWVSKVTRNSDGVVTDIHTPANITGYTHAVGSWAISTSTSVGLVKTFVLETTGQTKGFVLDRKYKTGTSGSAYFEGTVGYATASMTITNESVVRPVVDERRVYTEAITSGTSGSHLTEITPYWYSGTGEELMLERLETEHPIVTTGNNGPGGLDGLITKAHFTKQGRKDWEQKADGNLDYFDWSGGVVESAVKDVSNTFGTNPPTGFSGNTGGFERQDDSTFDPQGRKVQTTMASGNVQRRYVSKLKDERIITLAYAHYDATPDPDEFFGPVTFTVTNLAGKVEASGTVALTGDESTSLQTAHIDETESDPLLAIDIGSVGQMSTSIYGDSGQDLEESRSYFLVPASGDGSDGTNYDASFYGYDDEGRQRRVEDPSGTLRRTTYDAMGRVASRLIGTNDYGYVGGDASGTADMVTTELLEYDGNADDGNGYLTKRTLRVEDDSTNERVTTYEHDARGNVLLTTNPTAPHVFVKVDNLGRTIARGSFSATTNIVVGTDDPTTETSNRLALNQSFYDEMGRVYKTQRHQIDTADGSDDDNLVALTWYDAQGRVIMVDGEELSKTFYDRMGRVTHRFTLAKVDADEWNSGSYGTYADADDLTGDYVLLERQTTYESATDDNVIMEAVISRHHDDGSDGNDEALDSNADGDELKYTAANVVGRIQIRAMWCDGEGRGRVTTEVNYGTYGGSDFDRDGLTEPTRSENALRTDYVYNTDGTLQSVTDPRDLETRYTYDDAGRQTVVTRNYVNGTPSGINGDDDVQTLTVYSDGLRTKLIADLDGNGEDAGDQVTTYTYGTTKGTSAGDSEIGTGHLLQKIAYPDSASGTDVVTFAYNAQGQQVYKKDQATNVIETVFDDSGRELHRRVTSINTGAGFDNAVLRISTTYDSLGRRQLITQYDNATVGSGSVTDEVKYTYEGWGYISKIEQDNNSVVSGGGDECEISYTYEDQQVAGRNTIRRVNFVAPSGNTFDHEYRSVGNRFDDDCSRVTHIDDGTTLLALYAYNGVGQVVGIDYSGVDVKMERFGGGGYDRLDRFDRVTSDIWTAYSATATDVYDLDIVYDENGNITRTDDHVHPTKFDVVYTIDGLDRLSNAQEGDLNGTSTIQTEAREQDWTLDQVGNWDHAKLDLNGDNDYVDTDEYDDDRDHNAVNEITTRDVDNDSSTDYTLTYDAVGNLTDDAEEYEYVYDAFYRLRKVNDQSQDLVAEHRYDGLGHRIAEHADTDDDGDVDGNDEWHHFCYDERWRVVAMFIDSDTAPTEEFMHHGAGNSGFGGSSYIDEVARRDRDTDDNGSMEEQVFYCQNWRHDVVAIVDSSGGQLEMVRYSAYGVPFGLPGGDADSDGDCDDGDTVDTDQIQTWIDTPSYDVRGDMDLDGAIDASDKAAVPAQTTMAWGVLSSIQNDRSYGGYTRFSARALGIRHRALDTGLGKWLLRDPLEYADSMSMYEYGLSNPVGHLDPDGQNICTLAPLCGSGGEATITGPSDCLSAPPEDANSPVCDFYGSDRYMLWPSPIVIDLRCFCRESGNSDWARAVRGCLACMHRLGVGIVEAHHRCYDEADDHYARPYADLYHALTSCAVLRISGRARAYIGR